MSDDPFRSPPRRQISPMQVIARAVRMLKRDASTVLPLVLIWIAALTALTAGLFQLFGLEPALSVMPSALLLEPFFLGAFVYVAVGDYTPRVGEALDVGSRAYLTLLPAVFALNLIVFAGFMFMIFPGLAALAVFCLVYPIIMAERPGLQAAFMQSFARVLPDFWRVVATIMIVMIPGLIGLGLLTTLLTPDGTASSLGTFAALAIREALAGTALAYLGAALYFELTADKDKIL